MSSYLSDIQAQQKLLKGQMLDQLTDRQVDVKVPASTDFIAVTGERYFTIVSGYLRKQQVPVVGYYVVNKDGHPEFFEADEMLGAVGSDIYLRPLGER